MQMQNFKAGSRQLWMHAGMYAPIQPAYERMQAAYGRMQPASIIKCKKNFRFINVRAMLARY